MRALLRSAIGRVFAGVVLVLATATAVGLAVLWPDAESNVDLGPTLSAGSERAEVRGIDSYECSGFQTDTCRDVEIELSTGPEAGSSGRLELGLGAIDPKLAVGDEIRVAAQVSPEAPAPDGRAPLTRSWTSSAGHRCCGWSRASSAW